MPLPIGPIYRNLAKLIKLAETPGVPKPPTTQPAGGMGGMNVPPPPPPPPPPAGGNPGGNMNVPPPPPPAGGNVPPPPAGGSSPQIPWNTPTQAATYGRYARSDMLHAGYNPNQRNTTAQELANQQTALSGYNPDQINQFAKQLPLPGQNVPFGIDRAYSGRPWLLNDWLTNPARRDHDNPGFLDNARETIFPAIQPEDKGWTMAGKMAPSLAEGMGENYLYNKGFGYLGSKVPGLAQWGASRGLGSVMNSPLDISEFVRPVGMVMGHTGMRPSRDSYLGQVVNDNFIDDSMGYHNPGFNGTVMQASALRNVLARSVKPTLAAPLSRGGQRLAQPVARLITKVPGGSRLLGTGASKVPGVGTLLDVGMNGMNWYNMGAQEGHTGLSAVGHGLAKDYGTLDNYNENFDPNLIYRMTSPTQAAMGTAKVVDLAGQNINVRGQIGNQVDKLNSMNDTLRSQVGLTNSMRANTPMGEWEQVLSAPLTDQFWNTDRGRAAAAAAWKWKRRDQPIEGDMLTNPNHPSWTTPPQWVLDAAGAGEGAQPYIHAGTPEMVRRRAYNRPDLFNMLAPRSEQEFLDMDRQLAGASVSDEPDRDALIRVLNQRFGGKPADAGTAPGATTQPSTQPSGASPASAAPPLDKHTSPPWGGYRGDESEMRKVPGVNLAASPKVQELQVMLARTTDPSQQRLLQFQIDQQQKADDANAQQEAIIKARWEERRRREEDARNDMSGYSPAGSIGI